MNAIDTSINFFKHQIPYGLNQVRNYIFPTNLNVSQSDQSAYRTDSKRDLAHYPVPVQLQRIRQDVLSWRKAMQEAEQSYFPHRVKMMQMFYDTINNGDVYSILEKRKNLTMLKNYKIVDSKGNDIEKTTELFTDKVWFSNFISYALDAQFFGYSLIQLGDLVEDEFPKCQIVKRHNVSPDRHNVTSVIYSLSGQNFLDADIRDWYVWCSTPNRIGTAECGFGLLYVVALYEIFLRNTLGYNGDFVELFAQPYRVAKSSKKEGPEYDMLEMAMRNMGATNYAIIDPQDEIEFIESKLGGTGFKAYESFDERNKKIISKIILGHEDAISATAGKLGSGDNEESDIQQALEDVERIDSKYIKSIINSQLIPKMRKLGVNIPIDAKFEWVNDKEKQEEREREDEINGKLATVVKTLFDAGFEVDENYIIERSLIPIKKKEIVEQKPLEDFKNRINSIYEAE